MIVKNAKGLRGLARVFEHLDLSAMFLLRLRGRRTALNIAQVNGWDGNGSDHPSR
jgi:hypothetical protein